MKTLAKPRGTGATTRPARGIVEVCVGAAPADGAALLRAVQSGLDFSELETLRRRLDVPMERLAMVLGLSKATLHRRKLSGRLDAVESDRVVRFARLLGRAAEVMESLEAGRAWLAAPQFGLGGGVPLAWAQTEVGAREVENLLGRLEFGVYA